VAIRTLKAWNLVGVVVAVLMLAAGDAAANVTYEYLGNNFDTIEDDTPPAGTYTTDMRVTVTLVLQSPLAANLDWLGTDPINPDYLDSAGATDNPGTWTLIPESSTALLAGLGLTMLGIAGRRRR
jgi:hypothetical protein